MVFMQDPWNRLTGNLSQGIRAEPRQCLILFRERQYLSQQRIGRVSAVYAPDK